MCTLVVGWPQARGTEKELSFHWPGIKTKNGLRLKYEQSVIEARNGLGLRLGMVWD